MFVVGEVVGNRREEHSPNDEDPSGGECAGSFLLRVLVDRTINRWTISEYLRHLLALRDELYKVTAMIDE